MFNNTVVMYTIVMHKYTICNIARSDVWWNNVVMRTFIHQDWLQNFIMCKETFLYIICNHLSSELERRDTVMRRPLSVQGRVAVCLWCLATPIEYRIIASSFVWYWSINCLWYCSYMKLAELL